MIPISHILVLSQPEFVRDQVETVFTGERPGGAAARWLARVGLRSARR